MLAARRCSHRPAWRKQHTDTGHASRSVALPRAPVFSGIQCRAFSLVVTNKTGSSAGSAKSVCAPHHDKLRLEMEPEPSPQKGLIQGPRAVLIPCERRKAGGAGGSRHPVPPEGENSRNISWASACAARGRPGAQNKSRPTAGHARASTTVPLSAVPAATARNIGLMRPIFEFSRSGDGGRTLDTCMHTRTHDDIFAARLLAGVKRVLAFACAWPSCQL